VRNRSVAVLVQTEGSATRALAAEAPLRETGAGRPGTEAVAIGRTFTIDTGASSVQSLAPPSKSERLEGVAFSPSGKMIAAATSESNCVLLFRRGADGRFEDAPFQRLGGLDAPLNYPHDVAISLCEDAELLAVAQRAGAIAIFQRKISDEKYAPEPKFEISGPESTLAFSDGVAFVPPRDDYLAACNLEKGTIAFFRRVSMSPIQFEAEPEFELKHRSIYRPDGLAFSSCGSWLAVANHGDDSVSIFRRGRRMFTRGRIEYGPAPVTVIRDPRFRCPHSVAFSPRTSHLVVTNAGANYFNAYAPERGWLGMRWSESCMLQVAAGDERIFREINMANKMEGGPKGVAISASEVAVCSPEFGIRIYSYRE